MDWPTIPVMTAAAAKAFPNQVAIADGPVELSYPALLEQAGAFAAAPVASGLEPGERVAIWCCNCAGWVIALLGIYEAGAVLVPLNTRCKGEEAASSGRAGLTSRSSPPIPMISECSTQQSGW